VIADDISFIDETQELVTTYENLFKKSDEALSPREHQQGSTLQETPTSHVSTPKDCGSNIEISPGHTDPHIDSPPTSGTPDATLPFSSTLASPLSLCIGDNLLPANAVTPSSGDRAHIPVAIAELQNPVSEQIGSTTDHVDTDVDFDVGDAAASTVDTVGSAHGLAWPLYDVEEAMLMRYFVENTARSFDLTDSFGHFRNVVPQRAAVCPILLYAILAAAARHLS